MRWSHAIAALRWPQHLKMTDGRVLALDALIRFVTRESKHVIDFLDSFDFVMLDVYFLSFRSLPTITISIANIPEWTTCGSIRRKGNQMHILTGKLDKNANEKKNRFLGKQRHAEIIVFAPFF